MEHFEEASGCAPSADLGLAKLFVVYPGSESYPLDERIDVLPVTEVPRVRERLHDGDSHPR